MEFNKDLSTFSFYKRQDEFNDDYVLMAWEQGTGKTYTALNNIYKNHKYVENVLVLAPSLVLKDNWIPSIKELYGYSDHHFHLAKSGKKIPLNSTVYLFNYESLVAKNFKEFLEKKFNPLTFYVIIDESHLGFKTFDSKRTWFFKTIVAPKLENRVKLLTGTPLTNKVTDIYSQLSVVGKYMNNKFTGKPLKNYYAFCEYFCQIDMVYGAGGKLHKVYRALREDREDWFKQEYARFADVYTFNQFMIDNPIFQIDADVYRENIIIEPDEITKKHTDSINNNLLEFVTENGLDISNELKGFALGMKLRTLANGFLYYEETQIDDSTMSQLEDLCLTDKDRFYAIQELKTVKKGHDVSNIKLKALLELLDRFEKGTQVIIYDWFRHSIQNIYNALINKGYTVSYLNDDNNNSESIQQFKEGKTQIILANPAKASTGLNLQNAHVMIFFSNSFDISARLQGESRIYRIGQKGKCSYYNLVIKDSIEEHILDVLENRSTVIKAINSYIEQVRNNNNNNNNNKEER